MNLLWVPLGLYEPVVSQWLVSLLGNNYWRGRGVEVWDVGANVGVLSLLCAHSGAAHVVAFEPSEANLARLEGHLQANHHVAERIEVIPVAVSDVDGETEFLVGDSGSEGQISRPGVRPWDDTPVVRSETVKTVRLDSMLASGRPAPDILKIDVEGAEVLVLAGAQRLLQRHPIVLLEVHNDDACRGCVALLNAAGYTTRQIVGRHLRDLRGGVISYGHLLALPPGVECSVGC